MLGNTKKVEKTTLKTLFPRQELSNHSIRKGFTRHFTNTAFYLPPSEYVLFQWLVYYSDGANVFTYSAELLRMYDKASDKAIEIYGAEQIHYKTSMTNARESFISLIEKGLFIILSSGEYMVNPYVVYSGASRRFSPKNTHKAYLKIVNTYEGEELSLELTKFCDEIQASFVKELLRTNVNLRKINGEGDKKI